MAERRSRFFIWFALAVFLVFVGLSAWLIRSAMLEVHAPQDEGVCWRRGPDGKLAVLSRGINSMGFCVGELERIHMRDGKPVEGAYQGHFLFIDNEAIRSADTMTGQRWRLYFDNQRKDLDKDLNAHEMTFTTQR